jgi:hypothetical protein
VVDDATNQAGDMGLYVNQDELLKRLSISEKAWGRARPALSRQGFPERDPIFNKWFWPAVKMFLYRRYGLSYKMDGFDETESEEWDE